MYDISQVPAVILAGGLGTRLRKAVSDRPKVMTKVNGKPFVYYLLDKLDEVGICCVLLCTGYMGDYIRTNLGKNYERLTLTYSEEDKPLGTGGALKIAQERLDAEHVLVMNGDSYVEYDLPDFIEWHIRKHAFVSMILADVEDVSRYGNVVMNSHGVVTGFSEKRDVAGPGWINAGVYLLEREVMEGLPDKSPSSLEEHFFPSMIGKGMYGYRKSGRFIDIGTPDSLETAGEFFSNYGNT